MTRERYEQIKAAALRLAREIEWADFPNLPLKPALEWHNLLHRMTHDPNFQLLLQNELIEMFKIAETQYPKLPGHQEIELEGAGLVQYAIASVLVSRFPVTEPVVSRTRIRTKFRSIAEPLVMAPSNMKVPSLKEQRADARLFLPDGGRA